MPGRPPVTKIVASTQIRAKQMANIIHLKFQGIETEEDPMLMEGSPDLSRDCARFESSIAAYFKPALGVPKTNIIVCHSNIMLYFVCRQVLIMTYTLRYSYLYRVLGIDICLWRSMQVPHCGNLVPRLPPPTGNECTKSGREPGI